jgi:hypothetical protein
MRGTRGSREERTHRTAKVWNPGLIILWLAREAVLHREGSRLRDRLAERRVVARFDDGAGLIHRAADRAEVIDEVREDRLAVRAVGSGAR